MKRKWYSVPYLVWLIIFSVVPLLFIAYFAFTTRSGDWTLANIQKILQPRYMAVLGESIVIALECTLICLLVIKNALTRLSVVRHYPSYSARLSYGTTSVRQLSVALGHSPAKVIKNVKKMIAYALLPGCYYDSHIGCVVMPGIPVSTPTPPGAYTVVRCDSCGAKNKVAVGQVTRCEFCGTKIKG